MDMCSDLGVEVQFVGTVDQVTFIERTDIGEHLTPFSMCVVHFFNNYGSQHTFQTDMMRI